MVEKVKQSQTKKSNKSQSWVEQGRILGRTWSNDESNRAHRVKQGQIMGQNGSSIGSNRVGRVD